MGIVRAADDVESGVLGAKFTSVDSNIATLSSQMEQLLILIALRLVKTHMLLPHTPIWERHLFGISSLGLKC